MISLTFWLLIGGPAILFITLIVGVILYNLGCGEEGARELQQARAREYDRYVRELIHEGIQAQMD